MNIYVYSDESGVFDRENNDLFVYDGLVLLSKEEHETWKRKYLHVERTIRKIEHIDRSTEVKAFTVSNKSKGKLYRSLNHVEKFGVVIHEKSLLSNIFEQKKSKQRYLDYAYKIALKRKFENLIKRGIIIPEEVNQIIIFVDEHTTATNGKYELEEALRQEFKFGTYNWNWQKFFPPVFPTLKELKVKSCNSQKITLIRSADIIANRLYRCAVRNNISSINKENFKIIYQP